jgi:hypothetical protein
MVEYQQLRERAQKCRMLASGLSSRRDIDTLHQLAAEYEAEAARAERRLRELVDAWGPARA